VKRNLKNMNITWEWEEAEELAAGRTEWRRCVANRTRDEQNRTTKQYFFILYFENTFWSILLFAKYFF